MVYSTEYSVQHKQNRKPVKHATDNICIVSTVNHSVSGILQSTKSSTQAGKQIIEYQLYRA